ncbi:MAG: DUF4915 domain-containing protein [Actinomycetota bacterium]|nr:DUF4915 domain-containing protein [Actinomycetota bacterium]
MADPTTGTVVGLVSADLDVTGALWECLAGIPAGLLVSANGRLWVLAPDDGSGAPGVAERGLGGAGPLCRTATGVVAANPWQVWTFVDAAAGSAGGTGGRDILLVPQAAATVGSIGVCDIAADDEGALMVVGRFDCLARLDRRHSFRPVWMPPWVTGFGHGDLDAVGGTSNLGGVALAPDGRVVVSAAGRSPEPNGWREGVVGGGVVVSSSGDVLATDLTLPRQVRADGDGYLVVESGTGRLLRLGTDGAVDVVIEVPAVLTGLDLQGRIAVVGWMAPGDGQAGLPVADGPASRAPARWQGTGVAVVDIVDGTLVASARFLGKVDPVVDAVLVGGGRRVDVLAPRGDAANRTVVVGAVERLPDGGTVPATIGTAG